MRTLRDLMNSPLTNPYSIDILTPRTRRRPTRWRPSWTRCRWSSRRITLSSFVPADQRDKLAIIADAASILDVTLAPRAPPAPVTAADLRLAAKTALAGMERAAAKLPPGSEVAGIADALRRLAAAPDATLLAANAALTRFLPLALDRLRTALDAQPVTARRHPARPRARLARCRTAGCGCR